MNNVNDDARGNTILFVSHCILNQNAKVRGIATHPGAVRHRALLAAGQRGTQSAVIAEGIIQPHVAGGAAGPRRRTHQSEGLRIRQGYPPGALEARGH